MFRTTLTYKYTEGGIEHTTVTENREMVLHYASVHGMIQGLLFSGPIILIAIDSKEI